MSVRREKFLALANIDYAGKSIEELRELFRKALASGMHGLCSSPIKRGSDQEISFQRNRLEGGWRLCGLTPNGSVHLSCTEGNEMIAKIAKEMGMKTLVGAWLGDDPEINEKEVGTLIQLAKEGYVDIAAVGNEVMYRGDLTEEELLAFINKAKEEIPDEIPVGYVDAYYEFTDRSAITDACDLILANCYPFWEGCDLDYSLLYMKDMYNRAKIAGNGKRVIITETGWPSEGTNLRGAFPSEENAIKYFINAQKWSQEDDIEMFYFSSFDESWKVGAEGDVGAYWGIWDKDEKLKY